MPWRRIECGPRDAQRLRIHEASRLHRALRSTSSRRVRRDLHAHPELAFEEHRTAARRAGASCPGSASSMHTGIGKTGVVGVIRGTKCGAGRSVGLRADMDALPMHEENDFAYKSRTQGRMHGCGHDGHTTMLLGAARYLAETRNFDGTAVPDLPARRGRLRRRQGDDRGRPVRALSGRTRCTRCTTGRACRRASIGMRAGPDDGGGRPHRDHDRPARAGMARMPTWRSTPVLVAAHIITARCRASSRATCSRSTAPWSACARCRPATWRA